MFEKNSAVDAASPADSGVLEGVLNQGRPQQGGQQHQRGRRQDAAYPARIKGREERANGRRGLSAAVAKHQARDQVARDHVEDVDADVSTGKMRHARVEGQEHQEPRPREVLRYRLETARRRVSAAPQAGPISRPVGTLVQGPVKLWRPQRERTRAAASGVRGPPRGPRSKKASRVRTRRTDERCEAMEIGGPNGNRTRAAALKEPCPNL